MIITGEALYSKFFMINDMTELNTVLSLKEKICELTGIEINNQIIVYYGIMLKNNDDHLGKYGLIEKTFGGKNMVANYYIKVVELKKNNI